MNNHTVTKLEKQKKRERCNVWLDGAYSFSLSLNLVAEFDLYKGKILQPQDITTLKQAESLSEVYRRALIILSYRMHGEEELANKLRKHFDEVQVKKTIQKLRRLGLLNDAHFLQVYIENSSKSKKAITWDLLKKGFSKTQIQPALESLSDKSEMLKVKKILAKKNSRSQKDPKEKAKIIRALAAKGFSYRVIKRTMEEE